ncbi:MAG: HdeA/HdeB family chaperone [Gammaproteobacteria bacterium]
MKRTHVMAVLVLGALVTGGGVTAAEHHAASTGHPRDLTCKDLLVTDMEYVPEVVYWHDGWNARDGVMTEVIDEDWLPVEVDQVWSECQKDPTRKVGDVVAAQRATQHAAGHHARK